MRTAHLLFGVGAVAMVARLLDAQAGVVLQIKPHVGDTLLMRLDQQTAMSGVRGSGSGETSAMVANGVLMFSRAIVEPGVPGATTLLAIMDSVVITTSDKHGRVAAQQVGERLRGQRVRFRVSPDGTVGMNGGATSLSRQASQSVSLVPAAFPTTAVHVGERWVRELPLPTGGEFGTPLSGTLRATFRLDSVTHRGEFAYVSMQGELRPAIGPGLPWGTVVEDGMVQGTILVNQRRGWLTDTWFTIVIRSTASSQSAMGGPFTHVRTRITQHMHTLNRR